MITVVATVILTFRIIRSVLIFLSIMKVLYRKGAALLIVTSLSFGMFENFMMCGSQ